MSGHGLTAEQEAASQAPVVRPIVMVRLDYPSAPVCAHSHIGTVTYNGEPYLGVGQFGGVSRIEEQTEVRPNSVQITLSGIPPEYLAQAIGEHYQGRDARVMIGLCDGNFALIGVPVVIWRGTMDFADIEMGTTSTITVNAESWLADWQRPRERRYTHEDQQDLYPGDLGLEFVAAMVQKEIMWGKTV